MPNMLFLALSNCEAGAEDEFNDWYSNRHIPDLLAVPGVVSARRYELAPTQRFDPPYDYRYLALYEVEPDRYQEVIGTVKATSRTEKMPVSDKMTDKIQGLVFMPIPLPTDPD